MPKLINPEIPAPRSNTSRMKLGPLLMDRSGNANAIRITPFISYIDFYVFLFISAI